MRKIFLRIFFSVLFEILFHFFRSSLVYRGSNYNILKNNCNTFSEDLCQFLCGSSIPKYILDLPQEFLTTPLGQTLGPLIGKFNGFWQIKNSNKPIFLVESLGARSEGSSNFSFEPHISVNARSPSPDLIEINTQIEQLRAQSNAIEESRKKSLDKIAKRENKKEKKKKKKNKEHKKENSSQDPQQTDSSEKVSSSETSDHDNTTKMSETNGDAAVIPSEMLPSEKALEDEAEERRAEEERKKNREPPVVFKEVDVSFKLLKMCDFFSNFSFHFQPKHELESLVKLVDGKLSEEEQIALEELHQYLLLGDGCWALSDAFLVFVGRVLRDSEISTEARVHLLRALAFAALKDDIILLLHQDRRDHVMMNYAFDIDRIPPEEQQALALFVSCFFSID